MQYQQPSCIVLKKSLRLGIAALLLTVLAITLLTYTHNAHAANITSAKSQVTSTCGSWNVIPNPNPGVGNESLYGIAAVSVNNVWAVGNTQNNGVGNPQTLIEHWNGTTWNVVSSPNPGSWNNDLVSVVRVPGSKQLWAVGITSNSDYQNNLTLTEYWNGTNWSVVPSSNPGVKNEFNGVTAVSVNNIWAVGDYLPNSSNYSQTLIEHWDGTIWSAVSSPNVGTSYNYLEGVARVPGTNQVWAVGFYNAGSYTQTLIEFYC